MRRNVYGWDVTVRARLMRKRWTRGRFNRICNNYARSGKISFPGFVACPFAFFPPSQICDEPCPCPSLPFLPTLALSALERLPRTAEESAGEKKGVGYHKKGYPKQEPKILLKPCKNQTARSQQIFRFARGLTPRPQAKGQKLPTPPRHSHRGPLAEAPPLKASDRMPIL